MDRVLTDAATSRPSSPRSSCAARRVDVGYRTAQAGAAGAALGGAFDLCVPRLLPFHEAYLSVDPGHAPPATATLVLLLLHALGAALLAAGTATLALLTAWRRTGVRGFAWTAAAVEALAEGVNAWGIARVGSFNSVGPALFAGLVVAGVALAQPASAPAARRTGPPRPSRRPSTARRAGEIRSRRRSCMRTRSRSSAESRGARPRGSWRSR